MHQEEFLYHHFLEKGELLQQQQAIMLP